MPSGGFLDEADWHLVAELCVRHDLTLILDAAMERLLFDERTVIHPAGLPGMAEHNTRKAGLLYSAIDQSGGFYRGHALPEARSQMNVTFRLKSEALEKQFATEAQAAGMVGLPGHRSVGGLRASIYNAVPIGACQTLASFMADFARRNG